MDRSTISIKYRDSNFYELLQTIEIALKATTVDTNRFAKRILLYAPAKTGKSFILNKFCEELKIQLFEVSIYDEHKIGELFTHTAKLNGEFNIVHLRHVNIGFSDSTNVKQLIEKLNLWIDLENKSKRVMLIVSTNEFNSNLYEICNGYMEYKFGALSLIEKKILGEEYLNQSYCQHLEINENDITYIIKNYTLEAGIGQLKNCLDQLIEYCYVTNNASIVSKEVIKRALGESKYTFTNVNIDKEMGNGLAWTPYGGKILNLEILDKDGTGKINIWGNIKKTMSDSILMSYEILFRYAEKLGVSREKIKGKDLFFSIPELGENKDGASMGLAIFFKLYCFFTEKKVNRTIALTGEIMMNGDVIRVGGLKEKLNAAYAHDIKIIFLPQKSKYEISRLPDSLTSQFEINLVHNIFELIHILNEKKYFS